MVKLKISQIGNSIGVILPKETLSRLNVVKGDTVFLLETSDGYTLTAFDPDFADELRLAEEGSQKYRNALRALAE